MLNNKRRVWHKKKKEWFNYRLLNYGFTIDGRFTVDQVIVDDGVVEVSNSSGLEDKNGKEIYEGDIIVSTKYPWMTAEPVRFENGTFAWKLNGLGAFVPNYDLEIIGNIYENPDWQDEESPAWFPVCVECKAMNVKYSCSSTPGSNYYHCSNNHYFYWIRING